MRSARFLLLAAGLAAVAAAAPVGETLVVAEDGKWTTIKGQIVLPANVPIPVQPTLNVTQDKPHCLSKGELKDQSIIVNPKNRGIKNVVVWLRPDDADVKKVKTLKLEPKQIYAGDAARKPGTITLDQPVCLFAPRVTIGRVGDTLEVKNSAPVPHNFFWSSSNNGEYNVTIPAGGSWKMPMPLQAEGTPIQFKCTIHPWMDGYFRVFDHPYYAVTDEDGKFEIKNAPAGKFRLVTWHEKGFKGGAAGRVGDQVDITGATMEMKPTDFDVTANK